MSINLTVVVDNDEAIRKFRELQKVAKTSTSNIVSDTDRMDMAMRRLGTAIGSLGLGFSFSQLARNVANVRGEFQQLEVAFTTMLGSKAEADMLMARTVEFAAKTPFDLQGVASGTKQLLAFGSEASEVTDEMRMLGDIAAGLSIPIGDLVYLYGTTRTQGRMFTMDLRQFMGRGIPLAEELAKQFGVTKNRVSELVTEGKVGFEDMRKALVSMTSEGGKFYNLMEEQSKTITGQMSNLEDSIQQMFNAIGKESEGVITSAIEGASYLVENYEKVGRVLMDIVAAYGSYKAAVMLVNAVSKTRAIILAAETVALRANAIAHTNLTSATVLLNKAMKALNITALKNPYVLAGTAVAALTFGIYKLITAKSAEEKAIDSVNRKLDEYESSQKELGESAIRDAQVMQDVNAATVTRVAAYNSLIKKYPELLAKYDEEAIKLMTIANLQREIDDINMSRSMSSLNAQKDELETMIRAIDSRKKKGVDGNMTYANASDAGMKKTLLAELDEVNKRIREQIRLQEQAVFDSLSNKEKIEAYEAEIAAIDMLLDSTDQLRQSESRSTLLTKKSDLQKRVESLKKAGTNEVEVEVEEDDKKQKEIDKARQKAQEEAHKAEMDLQKSYITDKVMLLNLEKEEVLEALQEQIDATNDLVEKGYLERAKKAREAIYDNQMDALLSDETERIIGSIGPVFDDTNRIGIQTTPPDLSKIFKEEAEKSIPVIESLFGDMRNLTSEDLNAIADEAEKMLKSIDDPEKLSEMRNQIDKFRNKANELESPLVGLKNGFKELFQFKPNTEGWNDALDKISTGLKTVAEVAEGLDSVLDSVGAGEAMDGVMDGINAAISAVDAAGKGAQIGSAFGPIGAAAGAAIGAVGSLVKSISQIHDKNSEKRIQRLQEQIESLEDSYERLGRAVDDAYSTDASELIEQQNKLLEQQKVLIKQQIDEEEDKKKTDKDRIKDWQKQIEDIDNAISDNAQKAQEAITGISFDSFRDSFYSSLSDMSKSSEDFAKDFENMLMKAILNSLMAEKYDDRIKALYDGWAEMAKDGLSEDEIARLRDQQDQIVEDMTKDRDELAKIYGWDTSDAAGSSSATSKGFQSMSQETGSELNGRFTDIQGKVTDIRSFVMEMMATGKMHYAEMINVRDIMLQINGNVADISLYTKVLPEMRDAINTMNRKLDNL